MSRDSSYEFAPEEQAREVRKVPQAPPPEAVPERTCPHCGFRIVGRTNRPRCPECSAPLDVAAADLLQFSGVPWVRRISWGPLLVGTAILMHVGGVVIQWTASTDMHDRLARLLHLAAAALALVGIWTVSAREGRGAPQRRPMMGILARVAAWGTLALFVGVVVASFSKNTPADRALMLAAMATMAVGTLGLCFFLAALAARIPNDGLANQFQNLAWVLPAVLGVMVISQFVDNRFFFEYLFFCGFPMIGGLAGLVAWGAITMVRLTLDLRNAATAAEDIVAHRIKRAEQAEARKAALAGKPGAGAAPPGGSGPLEIEPVSRPMPPPGPLEE